MIMCWQKMFLNADCFIFHGRKPCDILIFLHFLVMLKDVLDMYYYFVLCYYMLHMYFHCHIALFILFRLFEQYSMLVPIFSLKLNHSVLPRTVSVGKFDAIHPSLVCGINGGKVTIYHYFSFSALYLIRMLFNKYWSIYNIIALLHFFFEEYVHMFVKKFFKSAKKCI